jgi:hypothetical protein
MICARSSGSIQRVSDPVGDVETTGGDVLGASTAVCAEAGVTTAEGAAPFVASLSLFTCSVVGAARAGFAAAGSASATLAAVVLAPLLATLTTGDSGAGVVVGAARGVTRACEACEVDGAPLACGVFDVGGAVPVLAVAALATVQCSSCGAKHLATGSSAENICDA